MSTAADQDRPIALIVEDDAESLKTRQQFFAGHGFQAIGASSAQEAMRQFRSTPMIDIVVTDINLENEDPANRSGLTLATEIRNRRPMLPVMGLSGCIGDGDLEAKEENVFTECLPKGTFRVQTLEERIGRWRESAIEYRRDRATAARQELDEMRRLGGLPAPRLETKSGFLPGTHPLEPGTEPATPDEMLRNEGWRLHLVEAGFSWRDSDDAEDTVVRTVSVVPFWIRQQGSTTMALLHGFPHICGHATLEDEAVKATLSLMYGHHGKFAAMRGKRLAPDEKALRAYLRRIFQKEPSPTGRGTATKRARKT